MPNLFSRFSMFSQSFRGFASLTTSKSNTKEKFKILVPNFSSGKEDVGERGFPALIRYLNNPDMQTLPDISHFSPFVSSSTQEEVNQTYRDIILAAADGVVIYLDDNRDLDLMDGIKLGYLLRLCESLPSKMSEYHKLYRDDAKYSWKIPMLCVSPLPLRNSVSMQRLSSFIFSNMSSHSVYEKLHDLKKPLLKFVDNMHYVKESTNEVIESKHNSFGKK